VKKIIFTGGGTAGHVIPNISIINELDNKKFEIFYIGSKKGIEKELIDKEQIPYIQIFSEKLRDMVSRQTPLSLVKNNGDITFEGYVSDFQVSPVSVQAGDVVGKNRLTITVHVKYTVTSNDKLNYEENFTRFADFDGNTNLASVQTELMNEISRQICEDVFNKSFNNW